MHALLFLSLLGAPAEPSPCADDLFELPAGFHIVRVATAKESGGSYDIAFDGDGRLLAGDGENVRRLSDSNGDGIYDGHEVIARGLGPRGPQGLLVLGDRLYAVGGDGVQLFTGYESGGPLVHRGRMGQPFGTGGDHDAHTVLLGHDGRVWFITGDGGGARDRVHITEDTSPALRERSASVFRFAPAGDRWECFATGGRNPPNLGMNWLGDLFSLDSDMEWHVDLPWWRPVRLHHWISGGDQGWQDVGAFPPYYIDCLPGILDVGRGSPDWGVFYEHTSFPERYRDAYFVCDYPSKSATTGGYETAGRLFVFFLERSGAGWKASHEVFAKPAPKREGKEAPSFALVDVEVAPDGSLFLSDHNQGIWRIFHGEDGCRPPPIVPEPDALPSATAPLIDALLALPQPASERSRKRAREILSRLGPAGRPALEKAALDPAGPIGRRIRAIRVLAPDAESLGVELVAALSKDASPEVRAQAAWLLNLRGKDAETDFLARLLDDPDPFVRRRAAEAATRHAAPGIEGKLLERLVDPERLVRYASMVALAKRPAASWLPRGLAAAEPKARMRALIAADLRREPPPDAKLRESVVFLLDRLRAGASKEDRLDLLRILGKFRRSIEGGAEADSVKGFLLESFPDPDRDVRWELARLIGEYRIPGGFRELLSELVTDQDPIAQFHLAQALARIREGWSPEEENRAIEWFLGTQKGWFAEPAGKGLQFPHFWATVVSEMATNHPKAMLRVLSRIELGGPLGGVAIDLVAGSEDPVPALMALSRGAGSAGDARRRILRALGRVSATAAREFLREEYLRDPAPETRGIILRGLASAPADAATRPLLIEGLRHENREVAQACLEALAKAGAAVDERLASGILAILARRIDLFRDAERALVSVSGTKRPGYEPEERDRPKDGEIDAGQLFWKAWYAERFGKDFDPASALATEEKEDEAVRDFLLSDRAGGGDPERGRKVYEAARCASCHGGLGKEGERLFGPDLAGVTRRLSRDEVVDAIVAPSKVVADRFKAVLVQMESGATISGFITERTEEEVVVADQERIHRLRASDVEAVHPLDTSLMPERLLNRSSWEEIRDLWAFMDTLGQGAAAPGRTREAHDWPGWRGPGGRGISPEKELPERWSATEGIAWKIDLPGWGNSSPAVVGNRIYVTTQTDDSSLHVLALDRDTGAITWDRIAGKGRLKAHELHNMATPTPAAAAEGVWALFGTGDLVHLDAAGKEVWRRNLPEKHGEYKILWGMGSSPVLHGDLLYVICLHKGPSYVLAVDRRTGEDVWKTPRDLPCREEAADSYSSPFILDEGGTAELIVSGAEHITAYDLRSGELLWTVPGVGIDHDYGRTMASPTGARGIVVGVSASVQGLGQMVGARAGAGSGEGATRKLWRFDKFTPDCPTPIIVGDTLHVLRDDGIGTALDLETGKKHWQKRLGRGNYKASPVSGDGKIYYLGWEGFCVVLRPGTEGEVIAENELDDAFIASPAISGGKLFFKGRKSLWAVGREEKTAKAGPATGLLRVHPENPRYFTDGAKTPSGSLRAVYLTGSHTWNNLVDMGRADPPEPFDFEAYLDFLDRHGHNFIRLWTWDSALWDTNANGSMGKDFVHRAAPLPWLRTGPGNALDEKPRFDLSKFDPIYFRRLRDRVEAAGRRGIYVSVMLFEGWGLSHGNRGRKAPDGWAWRSHPFHPANNVNGITPPGAGDLSGRVHALGNAAMNDLQAAYVRKVVDTVNDLDNVLYEVINEGGEKDWNRWVLKTVRDHERTKPKQHPIGLTGHGADDLASMVGSEADWVSPGSRDGYRDNPPAWQVGPKKPSLLDTDHIWGVGGSAAWVWKALLRGHNPIFMDPYHDSVLGEPGSRRWEPIRNALGAARRFALKVDLARMEPRNDLASTGYCLAEPGKAYAVYVPAGIQATVDLTGAAGELETEWIGPEGGDTVRGRIEGGGKRELSPPPWTGESGAVILIRQAAPGEI